MSRILPILFNTDMVRAILREVSPKTATRRTIKGYIPNDAIWGYTAFTPKGYISCRGTFGDRYGEKFFRLPCQPGDTLYVRETWCNANKDGEHPDYYYFADTYICEDYIESEWKWRPSIHMPKEAARIWLKVTDVRVERLQDVSLDDCRREGIDMSRSGIYTRFSMLWNSTIKKPDYNLYSWDANPWVWVIEFERCGKPEETL